MEKQFFGKCDSMCPKKEIVSRQEIYKLSMFEVLPNAFFQVKGKQMPKADPERMVKEYRSRSLKLGQSLDISEDVRTLKALLKTTAYLVHEILDADRFSEAKFLNPQTNSFEVSYRDIHLFLLDRLKAIRQDLSYYSLDARSDKDILAIYEQIIRFHIISIREDLSFDEFIAYDNKCSLWIALKDYMEIYNHNRIRGIFLNSGIEFFKFAILFQYGDDLFLEQILNSFALDFEVLDKQLWDAVEIISLAKSGNVYALKQKILTQCYLTKCITLPIINTVRKRTCNAFNTAFKKISKITKKEFMDAMMIESHESLLKTSTIDFFKGLGVYIPAEPDVNSFCVSFSNACAEGVEERLKRGIECEALFNDSKEPTLLRRDYVLNIF